ncbi:PDZ domain (Also known as DHR or GLGF) family protein [Acanthocheilonema viteae]
MSTTTDSAVIDHTANVHCQQNANYVTPSKHDVFVHHVECLRDGGILDPDDQLFDVFDENNDQILAIYDEPGFTVVDSSPASASRFAVSGTTSSSSSSATSKTAASTESPLDSKLNIISSSSDGDIVEITNIAVPPTDGLRVTSDNAHTLQQKPSSSSVITGSGSLSVSLHSHSVTHFDRKRGDTPNMCRIYHSALKNVSGSPKNKYRVTISPDVDCQPSQELSTSMKESLMTRTSARKSRLTDNFFDAKERLEEKLATGIKSGKLDMKMPKLIPPMEAANRGQTVIVLSDATINMHLGIEISPVHDPTNNMRLQAVEIRQIDDKGRVGRDGRLRIGDRIVEINQRPVYQMSISRARAYLHEIQAVPHPSLTIDRSIETFAGDTISHRSHSSTSSLQKRPILSALQQANTTALGITFPVEIVKRSGGFGFTITSRETAKGERLFYIGTVKADGAAVNKLRAGDRLLQIDGEKTTELTQNDMVERLKRLDVGDSINLLISRLGSQEIENQSPTAAKNSDDDRECCHQKRENEGTERYGEEILTLKIALNETGSAGLGISLKARAVMKPDGTRHDCGIFIKKVLHGGAAYKDGRLQLNDQLIGIEDIDLRRMMKNSEASDAITRCLKNIGPNASSVCLRVARKVELRRSNDLPNIKNSGDESLTLHCESSEVHDRSQAMSEDGDNAIIKKEETSNGYNADVSRHRLSSTDERSLNANEDLDFTSSSRQKCISEDEISHADSNAFSRKNPARRSISEKRRMGVGNDANNTVLFQKIKHSRQMSAPLLHRFVPFVSPTHRSLAMFSSRSATSLREKCRRRSLASLRSSDEKTVTGKFIGNREKITPIVSANFINNTGNVALSLSSPNRRSLSLESMEAHRSPMLAIASAHSDVPVVRDVRVEQIARRGHPSTLKRAQKSRPNGYTKPSISDAEDQSSTERNGNESYGSLPREISTTSKEKQQRRKSVGSSIFSKITQRLGGSRSRDTSPEKSVSFDIAESNSFKEKTNKTQDHRKWNKEIKSNQSIRRAPPPYKPSSSCDILQSADSDYYMNDVPGTHKTEIVCSGEELPANGYIRVANSKFYNSFIERSKMHPEIHRLTAIRQQSTTMNAIAEKEEIAKQETDVVMNYTRNSIKNSNNNDSNIQSIRNIVTKDDVNNSNNAWRITRDAVPTITMFSMPGLRTVQQPHAEIYHSLQEEEADIRPSTPTFPQQKQYHQIDHRCDKFTMKDSGRVQLSFSRQECERDRVLKGLVPTTQPAMPPIPAVFPTSRTFFFASSTRTSGHRTNDSQAGARSSLRNRAKSIFTPSSKEHILAENIVNQPRSSLKSQTSEHSYQNQQQPLRSSISREPLLLCSRQPQQKQSSDPSLPSSPHSKTSVPSVPHSPKSFDETTLSSPTYLQALLESPGRNCKDQDQQETADEFDYRKYLRSKRRNRLNDREQRITLIATVPDETIFVRGTGTCRTPRPSTLIHNYGSVELLLLFYTFL